jgi:hypothetical protein
MIHITLGSLKRVITAKQYYCGCVRRQQRRFIAGPILIPNISTNMRISQIINTSLGGKINFGNCYLGQQQQQINALRSIEGQPGGSFSPVRNKF